MSPVTPYFEENHKGVGEVVPYGSEGQGMRRQSHGGRYLRADPVGFGGSRALARETAAGRRRMRTLSNLSKGDS